MHGDAKFALERIISIIGEAATRVPDFVRKEIDVEWKKIVGTRNIVMHQYENVQPDILITAAKEDVPPMIQAIQQFLESQ